MNRALEFLGFDAFLTQSQVAQSGNPYTIGLNPRDEGSRARVKNFLSFISESDLDRHRMVGRLSQLGLMSELDSVKWQISDLLKGLPDGENFILDLDDPTCSEIKEITDDIDDFSEFVWADWEEVEASEILQRTGNEIASDDEEDWQLELDGLTDHLALEVSEIGVSKDCKVRLFGNFFTSSGGDLGFNALLRKGGYRLDSVDPYNLIDRVDLYSKILSAIKAELSQRS